MAANYCRNIYRGMQQGHYRGDINIRVCSQYIIFNMMFLVGEYAEYGGKYKKEELASCIVDITAMSLLSAKGIAACKGILAMK